MRRRLLRSFAGLCLGVLALLPAPTSAAPNEPLRIVVGYAPGASAAAVARTLEAAGVDAAEPLPELRAVLAEIDGGSAALRELEARPEIAFAEPDRVLRISAAPNDPEYARMSWPLTHTSAPAAWDVTTGDSSVVVAVVDTGVDASHPDLAGAVLAGRDEVNDDADASDDHGHGTLVAGTVAARAGNGIGVVGVCSACSILPVKVLNADGAGATSDVAAGIVWAADHGADVINLSLGGPGASATLDAAVAYATSRGALVVAAAGNDGTTVRQYPAASPGAVSVAATDEWDRLYSFSTHGSWVTLAAPGCVRSTVRGGGYGNACGTSFAAPVVAGVAALARTAAPGVPASGLVDALTRSADRVDRRADSSGVANDCACVAFGRVDAAAALAAVGATVPTSTPAMQARPTVSGAAVAGSTLRAAAGTWAGTAMLSYRYAFERCDAAGAACVALGPAGITQAYAIQESDAGATIRALVVAVNGGGTAVARSAASAVVGGAAPAPAPSGGGGAGGGALPPDLAVAIAADTGAPLVGSSLVYRVRVSTRGGSAERVRVELRLPSGVELALAQANRGSGCTSGATLVCDLDWISPAISGEVVLVVAVRHAGALRLHAAAMSRQRDVNPADDAASLTVIAHHGAPTRAPAPPPSSLPAPAPAKIAAPRGRAVVGKVLRARISRTGGRKVVAYRWQVCDGRRCTTIRGATGPRLRVRAAWAGKRLRALVVTRSAAGVRVLASPRTRPVRRV